MLILKPKHQYFSVFLQYFVSKISTSTEVSVWLEALHCTTEPLTLIYMLGVQEDEMRIPFTDLAPGPIDM